MSRGLLFLGACLSSYTTWTIATPASGGFEVVVGLPLRNVPDMDQLFWRVADPGDELYLRHRSVAQLSALISPAEEERHAARDWLIALGAREVVASALGDTLTGRFASQPSDHPLAASWSARGVPLKAAHARPLDFVYRRDTSSLSRPLLSPQAQPARASEPRMGYDIASQKKAYGMPLDLQATNDQTLQMVWGPGTFGYSKLQLEQFKRSESPYINMEKISTPYNHGKAGGDNFGEGNLDVRMITSFGLNVSTIVSNTNTSMSCEEGNGFGLAMLDWVTQLASEEQLPQTISLSLGSLSAASCDKLCTEVAKEGQSLSKCQAFLQEQRQVCMFIDEAQTQRINAALMALGLRGVSVFGSSGDGGSHWSFQEFSPATAMGRALNKVGCEFMFPIFPSPSPYMISVGGTQWKGGSGANPVAWRGSGGGFSWQFPAPAHQQASVSKYLSSTSGLPSSHSYNSSGRGYPDLSAVAVEGTSESSPTVAGIFSMIADHRLNHGLPPLGFLAPRLWKAMEAHPGVALENIAVGDSKTSCDNGFPASASGWDPVTGWGRPQWAGLLKLLGSDDAL